MIPRVMAASPQEDNRPSGGGTGGRRAKTVLLVEDHDEVRRVAVRILAGEGYEVLAAANPEEAQALARTNRVDILVTDVIMPGMNGPALAGTLAARSPGLRVLFLSGYGVEAMEERGLGLASSDFLQKPFSPAELLDAVRRVLEG